MKRHYYPISSYLPLVGAPVERWSDLKFIMARARKGTPGASRVHVYRSIWRGWRSGLVMVKIYRGKLVFCCTLPF